MSAPKLDESWKEDRGAVLVRIDHLEGTVAKFDRKLDAIFEKLEKIDVAVAALKVKSGIWGGIAGVLAVVLAYFIKVFSTK